MAAAWKATERQALTGWQWRVEAVTLPPRKEASFGEEASRKALEDAEEKAAKRNNAAFQLAWLKRRDRPIDFTCLDLGKALVLHLPGEPFVEYQLKAQELRPDAFVCVAGYGDDGPGYIPTDRAYLEGGYEPTVALAAPSEGLMVKTMAKLLGAKGNCTMPRCVDCGTETPREEMYGPPDELRCRACVQRRFPTTNVPTAHRPTVFLRWPPVTTFAVAAAVVVTLLLLVPCGLRGQLAVRGPAPRLGRTTLAPVHVGVAAPERPPPGLRRLVHLAVRQADREVDGLAALRAGSSSPRRSAPWPPSCWPGTRGPGFPESPTRCSGSSTPCAETRSSRPN